MRKYVHKLSFKHTTPTVLFKVLGAVAIGTAIGGEAKQKGAKWQKPLPQEKFPTIEFVFKKKIPVGSAGTLRREAIAGPWK